MSLCLFFGNSLFFVFCIFILWIGNIICDGVFGFSKIIEEPKKGDKTVGVISKEIKPKKSESNNAGAIIGVLERVVISVAILLKGWPVIAGVVALKSIARYKELDTQMNAEYFLIGSMISIVWAFIGTFIILYLTTYLNTSHLLEVNFINYIIGM